MRCLVIGQGSIGQRHSRMLLEMGNQVAVVSRLPNAFIPSFVELTTALRVFKPDYVVIANDTGKHAATLKSLADQGYEGLTLVEKPLTATSSDLHGIPSGPVFVGYTLRFHPVLQYVANYLSDQLLWSLTVYCGQFLPDWRPGRDYRKSYSARKDEGGVIRDLSHELDYVQWLAGGWTRTVAAGGRVSSLEIESEDIVGALAECERCRIVTIHLNYLDRSTSRWLVANGPFGTLKADMVSGTVNVDGTIHKFESSHDAMIRDQHRAIMQGANGEAVCTLREARLTMEWIDSLHTSAVKQCWVSRCC